MTTIKSCILLVDDDPKFIGKLKEHLGTEHRVVSTTDSTAAARYAAQYRPDVMLLDLNMPTISGLDILRHLKPRMPQLQIIMLTGESKSSVIVEAVKAGATDYIVKGSEDFIESLHIRIGQALQIAETQKENGDLAECLRNENRKYDILGVSPETVKLKSEIARYKGTSLTMLIRGENGTGKELVARQIHLQEGKPGRPFVEVNCGAIPRELFESEFFGHVKGSFTSAFSDRVGKFEMAHKGDIFLDEIGDLSKDMQVKLLRVLEHKKFTRVGSEKIIQVSVKVIAATNKNLEDMIRNGEFREDLYYRLNQVMINVPPLRERKEDIVYLAKAFAQQFMPGISFAKESKEILEKHRWSGNIRELKNTVERACILARGEFKAKIEPRHILLSCISFDDEVLTVPAELLPKTREELNTLSYAKSIEWMERTYLKKGLELTHDDNLTLMDLLNLKKTAFYEKKRKLGLSEKIDGTVA